MNNRETHEVNIVDIKMPFWSMVTFMVKAAIAFIPAFIILVLIGSFLFTLLTGITGVSTR